MTKILTLPYEWEKDIEPYLDALQPVSQGYTLAKRGVVTPNNGDRVFVKIGTSDDTNRWVEKEVFVYKTLNRVRFKYAPKLLSTNKDCTAMAIEYMPQASFENVWDKDKLDALMTARAELRKLGRFFDKKSKYMRDDYTIQLADKWTSITNQHGINRLNSTLEFIQSDLSFTLDQVRAYAAEYSNHKLKKDTLVHEDIRADNFGYDPETKTGKLIDWNWLCYSDDSLDLTPIFINIYLSGVDPYLWHTEVYDRKVILYLISFWLNAISGGSDQPDQHEKKRRLAQAAQLKVCLELLER